MPGAQAHTSSTYRAMLRKVRPVIRQMHANTPRILVAWEQVEPVEGHSDFSCVDTLLAEARQNDVRLAPLVRELEEHGGDLCARVGRE